MIIDYDDMVAAGMVKEASPFLHDETNARYAIYLSTPTGNVGKFRITTKDDVVNSIEAFEKNASLADYIKQPAQYYLQKAANIYGIDTPWDSVQPQHTNVVELRDSDPAKEPIYVLKVAGQKDIPIYDGEDFRRASDMFATAPHNSYSSSERIIIAGDMLKTAMELGVGCDPYITSYAHAAYSPNVTTYLDARINMTTDSQCKEDYSFLKRAYEELGDKLPPNLFVDALEGIDKIADIQRDPVQFFEG